MWHTFEADSGDQVWREVVTRLARDPSAQRQESRAGPTREILHAALTVRNPLHRWTFSRRPALNPAFALAEVVWLISGRADAKFLTFFNHSLRRFAGDGDRFHGAYGFRLRQQFGFDQLEAAYRALQANPASRQVILQIWDPRSDLPEHLGEPRSPDIPCNTQSLLKVRDGRLEWLQIMRSNDVFLGLPHNLVQFTYLQEIVAGWLGLQLGHYHHVSDSLHVYERDLKQVYSAPELPSIATDLLALPKPESDAAFALLADSVDTVVDETTSLDQLLNLPHIPNLPPAYRNILLVLLAEGFRRRNNPEHSAAVMKLCTNPAFHLLWDNWLARLATPRDGSTRIPHHS